MNVSIMEWRRPARLLLLASLTLFVSSLMVTNSASALSHIKSDRYGSSSVEGASVAAEHCGCMLGPAGPPGVPGVPGKSRFRCKI